MKQTTESIVGIFPMCADILHAGHCKALEMAKSSCDYLIVALNCSPSNKSPVQTVYERFVQLQSNKYVDEVIPYSDERDLLNLFKTINYGVRFIGCDHKCPEDTPVGIKDYETSNKPNNIVYVIKRETGWSSSNLKTRINSQYVLDDEE